MEAGWGWGWGQSRARGAERREPFSLQYERVLYVLDLLLGTQQPVLLVGEPGCGKTSFVETLVQPNHLCQRVCITFTLTAAHLRQMLQRKSREKGPSPLNKPAWAAALKGRCLFLVEDLHLAPLGECPASGGPGLWAELLPRALRGGGAAMLLSPEPPPPPPLWQIPAGGPAPWWSRCARP